MADKCDLYFRSQELVISDESAFEVKGVIVEDMHEGEFCYFKYFDKRAEHGLTYLSNGGDLYS